MNKSQIVKKLKEIGKVLNSDKAKAAIKHLEEEASTLIVEKSKKSSSTDLIVPREVASSFLNIGLFTDGACRGNPGPGSWAFLIQDWDGTMIEEGADVDANTTNNKMELSAIIKGLHALSREYADRKVFIYTDSKYAVDGMKSWVAGWKRRGWKKADKKAPENLELWKELDSLDQSLDLNFIWVKGHAGHPQNEHVDQLANIALDESGY